MHGKMYTCRATIERVYTEYYWYYNTCRSGCKKKLEKIGEHFWCNDCEEIVEYPLPRYRLLVEIVDGSMPTKMVMFDTEVEKPIGIPAQALARMFSKEQRKDRVLQLLQKCMGKRYVLKVKINDKGRARELTAQKIFMPNYALETAHLLKKIQEKDEECRDGEVEEQRPTSSQDQQEPWTKKQIARGKELKAIRMITHMEQTNKDE